MPSYATSLRNTRQDAITSAVGNGGSLRIYSGTPPANAGAALSGNTLLAQHTTGSPFASTSSNGVLSPTLPADVTIAASGTASFYRVLTSGGTSIIQGSVGTSGAELIVPNTTYSSGATSKITAWTMTEGNP
jgi:hypothetical protein